MENNQNKNDLPSKAHAEAESSPPYPPVSISEKNRLYGLEMLDNFGGENSEMTAVSLYLYNNLTLNEKFPEAARQFFKVNRAEMRHLQIFGELAALLGCDPRLWTHNTSAGMRYWSPIYVTYEEFLSDILKTAIASEKRTIEKYRRQAELIRDEKITAILERIIIDEQEHIRIFEAMRNSRFV